MRVKADTYNDETRLKHTVIDALEMDWAQLAKKLITDVESMGGQVPETVSLASFLPPCETEVLFPSGLITEFLKVPDRSPA